MENSGSTINLWGTLGKAKNVKRIGSITQKPLWAGYPRAGLTTPPKELHMGILQSPLRAAAGGREPEHCGAASFLRQEHWTKEERMSSEKTGQYARYLWTPNKTPYVRTVAAYLGCQHVQTNISKNHHIKKTNATEIRSRKMELV